MRRQLIPIAGVILFLCTSGVGAAEPAPPATAPATQAALEPDSARGTAARLLEALEAKDEAALVKLIAPGKDGSAKERAKQTLVGKGKLGRLHGAIRWGAKFSVSREEQRDPE